MSNGEESSLKKRLEELEEEVRKLREPLETTLMDVREIISNLENSFNYVANILELDKLRKSGEDIRDVKERVVREIEKPEEIDLIMIYRNSNGSIRAEWLPYDPSEDLERGWHALNVTYHGVEELKNPVAVDMSSGFWDDEESLAIRAWIDRDQDIAGEFMLIMVAPNGVRIR